MNLKLLCLYILPWIKASLPFDLHEIIFDSDPIEAGSPGRLKCKSFQMNVGQALNRFFSEIIFHERFLKELGARESWLSWSIQLID